MQRYRCTNCGKTFSESQPLDGIRLEADKAAQIVHLLCEGSGVRACARLAGVHKQTVLNIVESAGQHCADFLNAKLRDLKPTHVEIDEIWTFVLKKQYHAKNHPVYGDQYCWLSFDEPTKLILNWKIAKRNKEACMQFIGDLRSRVTDDVFNMTTDGWRHYTESAVWGHFQWKINYGTEIKKYGTLLQDENAERRYSPMICTSCRRTIHTGKRDIKGVTVNHAERQNLSIRLFTRRFTRLTLGYSKKLANLEHATALMVAFHNFCRPHSALYQKTTPTTPCCQRTPAMAFGLADHVWTVNELLVATAS